MVVWLADYTLSSAECEQVGDGSMWIWQATQKTQMGLIEICRLIYLLSTGYEYGIREV